MNKLIKNKRLEAFMLKQSQPYWTRIVYGRKVYMMSFQFNIWEVE